LLRNTDGSLYQSVEYPTAEKYASISERRRQQPEDHASKKGSIELLLRQTFPNPWAPTDLAKKVGATKSVLTEDLNKMAAEGTAEPVEQPDGTVRYRFPLCTIIKLLIGISVPADVLIKIEIVLRKAASSTWRSPSLGISAKGFQHLSSADSMRRAFDEIAAILFDNALLTELRLSELALGVWECAERMGWWDITQEQRKEFGKQKGHGEVWSDQEALFRAEFAKWNAILLGGP
jgi:hypothetical protein